MKKIIAAVLVMCLMFSCLPLIAIARDVTPEVSLEEFTDELCELEEEYFDEPVSNRLIVKSRRNIAQLDSVDIVEGYEDLHIVQFDNARSAQEALDYYNSTRTVEYVEEDYEVSLLEETGENGEQPDGHLSWGSAATGVDEYIPQLTEKESLPEIIVGICDTGIDLDHEFLEDRIIRTGYNISFTGEIDPESGQYTYNSEEDDNGHGTHVAGIIVDNTLDNVKVKAFKFLDKNGESYFSKGVTAVYAAIESGVNVINMSFGAQTSNSPSMEDAIAKACAEGIICCAAAGNSASVVEKVCPAYISECITVGAIDEHDVEPGWCNYGLETDSVDIVAPGVKINSSYLGNQYKSLSGTSMACPFVAAASALILSYNPSISYSRMHEILRANGRKWYDANNNNYGYYFGDRPRNGFVPALYIGDIQGNTISEEQCLEPEYRILSGDFESGITLEITTEDETGSIYYTLDGAFPSKNTGTLYTEPFFIDRATTVRAVVVAQGKRRSFEKKYTFYVIASDPEENFEIDDDGTITKYTGNNPALAVPEAVRNITVRAIGKDVFKNNRELYYIGLPDTVTTIGNSAFYYCDKLKTVIAKSIEYVDDYAFCDCSELEFIDSSHIKHVGDTGFGYIIALTSFDFSNLEYIGPHAFMGCANITYIYNDKIEEIPEEAFSCMDGVIYASFPNVKRIGRCGLENMGDMIPVALNLPKVEILDCEALMFIDADEINLPSLKTLNVRESNGKTIGGHFSSSYRVRSIYMPEFEGIIPELAFQQNENLRLVYAPKAIGIEESDCMSERVVSFFIPKAEFFKVQNTRIVPDTNPEKPGLKLYTSDAMQSIENAGANAVVIAHVGSYAQTWAENNGSFIDLNEVEFIGLSEDGMMQYQAGESVDEFPFKFVYESWSADEINKTVYTSNYLMLLDLNNDNFINAKDFAILNQLSKALN